MNYLLIENLQRFDYFYGEDLKVQCPTGSGNYMRLNDVAKELSSRLISLFIPDIHGYRPCHGKTYAEFHGVSVILCMLGNNSCFCCRLTFFKITF